MTDRHDSLKLSSLIFHLSSLKRDTLRFTLIELLVVIAIIAILAGMLLPALGRVRSIGKSVRCLSNTQGVGRAYSMYLDDFDGFLFFRGPYSHNPSVNGIQVSDNGVNAGSAIPEWMHKSYILQKDMALNKIRGTAFFKQLWFCPDPYRTESNYQYVFNSTFSGTDSVSPQRVTSCRTPARMMLTMEASSGSPNMEKPNHHRYMAFRHGNEREVSEAKHNSFTWFAGADNAALNMFYLDGHAGERKSLSIPAAWSHPSGFLKTFFWNGENNSTGIYSEM